MEKIVEELKYGASRRLRVTIRDDNNKLIEKRYIKFIVKSIKIDNYECIFLYDNELNVVEDVYKYINYKLKHKSYNTRILYTYILKQLYVDSHNVIQFKNQILESVNRQSAFVYISNLRTLIKYLEVNNKLEINPLVYGLLTLTNTKSNGRVTAYSKDEVHKILDEINNRSLHSETQDLRDLYGLIYIIINMILHTSMRLATILSLETGSLLESSPNSYLIKAKSKTTSSDQYNITKYIKDLYMKALDITKRYRANETNLFILKRSRNKGVVKINREQITNYLKSICEEVGIENRGVSGFRNRFMQDVTKYIVDTGSDQSLLGELSKHSLNIHYRYYFDNDIEELCSDLYGVNIGDISLKGRIVSKSRNDNNGNTVQNGCGFCAVASCYENSCLDCLMCKEFVTTPKHIKYFENEIEEIDKLIYKEKIIHEKEFLVTKKRLYVKYMTELIKLMSG